MNYTLKETSATITLPSILEVGQSFTIANTAANPLIIAGSDYKEIDLEAMGYVKCKKPW